MRAVAGRMPPPPGSGVSTPPPARSAPPDPAQSLMKQPLDHRAPHSHSTAMHNTVFQTPHPTNTIEVGSRDPDHPERGGEDIPFTTGNWDLTPHPPTHRGGGGVHNAGGGGGP